MGEKLIAVAKTSSKGSSLRITIPKEVAERLNISESEHMGFYLEGENIIVRKIEWINWTLYTYKVEFNSIPIYNGRLV